MSGEPRRSAEVVAFGRRKPDAPSHAGERDTAEDRDGPVPDLAEYEDRGGDDYRHRMLINAAVFAVAGLLIAGGIWLAITIADLRKTQDCVLAGRRNCAAIEAPQPVGR